MQYSPLVRQMTRLHHLIFCWEFPPTPSTQPDRIKASLLAPLPAGGVHALARPASSLLRSREHRRAHGALEQVRMHAASGAYCIKHPTYLVTHPACILFVHMLMRTTAREVPSPCSRLNGHFQRRRPGPAQVLWPDLAAAVLVGPRRRCPPDPKQPQYAA